MTALQSTNHTEAISTYSTELAKWQEAIAKRKVPTAINTADDFAATQAWINAAKKRLNELNAARKAATEPLDELKKALMETQKNAAAPLLADMEAVARLQKEYTDAIAWKAAEAKAHQAAMVRILEQAAQAAKDGVAKVMAKIASYTDADELAAYIALLQGAKPKVPPAFTDLPDAADVYIRNTTAAKPQLVQYAQERITALRAGAAVEIAQPTITADASMEVLAVMADATPEVQLKNVRKVLLPVVSFPCDLAALVQAALDGGYKREKLMEVLQGMAAKVAPGTAIRGVQWKEETKVINK